MWDMGVTNCQFTIGLGGLRFPSFMRWNLKDDIDGGLTFATVYGRLIRLKILKKSSWKQRREKMLYVYLLWMVKA